MNDSSVKALDTAAAPFGHGGTHRAPVTWLAPVVFLVHDLEEMQQVERMNALAASAKRRLPEPIAKHVPRLRYTRRGMARFAAGMFAAQVGLTLLSRRGRRAERALSLVLLVRFLNGASHISQSIALRRYVPGVATTPAIMATAALQFGALKRRRCGDAA
jgi:hypothetical protein